VNSTKAIQKDLKALKAKLSDEEISEKSLEAKLVERQSKVHGDVSVCWKNKSKLEYKKVEDLVNIKYNQALKQRFDTCDVIDSILLDDIDGSNE
ncbi:hypothetical protein CR513_13249, partial [Mucuna pruriens]